MKNSKAFKAPKSDPNPKVKHAGNAGYSLHMGTKIKNGREVPNCVPKGHQP